jgi:hypothetical protein
VLTKCKRRARQRVRNDGTHERQHSDRRDCPPCSARPGQTLGELEEKRQERAFDTPQASPEENRGRELAFEVIRGSLEKLRCGLFVADADG